MNIKLLSALGLVSSMALLAAPVQNAAAAGAKADTNCVSLLQIDHTHVVDNQNILFYMRGGDIYLNTLEHSAPGLDQNQPFEYTTPMDQLCKSDIITVLENQGFALRRGASSTLGKFVPIDKARAEQLVNDAANKTNR
jgi:hypothetical protein